MEAASYTCDNVQYRVEPITDYLYIDQDTNTVKDAITDTPIDVYQSNMRKAVDQELAFSVYKADIRVGFVYNYIEDYKYIGASVYIHNDIISAILGLRTIFEMSDAHKLIFTPHKNGLKYFKSMVTGPSIRAFHAVGTPVTILRKSIYEKGYRIYHYLGIA